MSLRSHRPLHLHSPSLSPNNSSPPPIEPLFFSLYIPNLLYSQFHFLLPTLISDFRALWFLFFGLRETRERIVLERSRNLLFFTVLALESCGIKRVVCKFETLVMNRVLPEMLHCPNTGDMTILDRKRSRTVKWQQQQPENLQNRQQQQQLSHFNGTEPSGLFSVPGQEQSSCFQGMVPGAARPVKPDPGLENGWPELGRFQIPSSGFGFDINSAISRTASCPPAVGKKRKAQNTKVAEEDIKDKRVKGSSDEGESKITTEQNSNREQTSADTCKDNSKASEVQTQKLDYIHVRARRGQATDSHSLAERVRREKISERMKYLQDLVPGCNKITGKAGMLDEIINYVESLQRQVEFLSMKLATIDPRIDFNTDHVFPKEMFPNAAANFPTIGMSSEMGNPAYLQFSTVQQVCGLEMGVNSSEMALRRTISTPVSLPEQFVDISSFTQMQPSSNWNSDLHNMYNIESHQGRPTSFQSQQFTGSMDAGI